MRNEMNDKRESSLVICHYSLFINYGAHFGVQQFAAAFVGEACLAQKSPSTRALALVLQPSSAFIASVYAQTSHFRNRLFSTPPNILLNLVLGNTVYSVL